MEHNQNKSIVLTVVGIILAVAGIVYLFSEDQPIHYVLARKSIPKYHIVTEQRDLQGQSEIAARSSTTSLLDTNPPVVEEVALDDEVEELNEAQLPGDSIAFEAWAAAKLQARFGHIIHDKSQQIELMGLRSYLMEHYPLEWSDKLYRILNSAFPEDTNQIFATFSQYDAYYQWFAENKSYLVGMPYQELKAVLGQKRQELFGDAAEEIWSPESQLSGIQDTLQVLEQARDITLDEKLQVFKGAVDDSFQEADLTDYDIEQRDALIALDENKKYSLTLSFFNMPSVQADLKMMDSAERVSAMRQIRRTMGIDEEILDELAAEDARKEQRWQVGSAYMAQREKLANTYSGPELDLQLQDLRLFYFKDEADTIAVEENSNFFRFQRPRVFGRN